MFCKRCGAEHPDGTRFCSFCGTSMIDRNNNYDPRYGQAQQNGYQNQYNQQDPYQQYNNGQNMYQNPYDPYYRAPVSNNGRGLAIASLVLGILSIFVFAVIAGPLGIIFGCMAKSNGYRGAMATAGIVCGIIGVVSWILMLVVCPDLMFAF